MARAQLRWRRSRVRVYANARGRGRTERPGSTNEESESQTKITAHFEEGEKEKVSTAVISARDFLRHHNLRNRDLTGNLPEGYVYIGRGSFWGNPFKIGEADGDRNEVVKKYRLWLFGHPDGWERLKKLESLHGKTLICWCKPAKCHGDLLALLADLAAGEDLHP